MAGRGHSGRREQARTLHAQRFSARGGRRTDDRARRVDKRTFVMTAIRKEEMRNSADRFEFSPSVSSCVSIRSYCSILPPRFIALISVSASQEFAHPSEPRLSRLLFLIHPTNLHSHFKSEKHVNGSTTNERKCQSSTRASK